MPVHYSQEHSHLMGYMSDTNRAAFYYNICRLPSERQLICCLEVKALLTDGGSPLTAADEALGKLLNKELKHCKVTGCNASDHYLPVSHAHGALVTLYLTHSLTRIVYAVCGYLVIPKTSTPKTSLDVDKFIESWFFKGYPADASKNDVRYLDLLEERKTSQAMLTIGERDLAARNLPPGSRTRERLVDAIYAMREDVKLITLDIKRFALQHPDVADRNASANASDANASDANVVDLTGDA
jgi:hypothetical protein